MPGVDIKSVGPEKKLSGKPFSKPSNQAHFVPHKYSNEMRYLTQRRTINGTTKSDLKSTLNCHL